MSRESGTVTYPDVLAANIRAARARAGISQKQLAERMRGLGFKWVYQTVGKSEHCERPMFAAEVLGLALALEVSVSELMGAAESDGKVCLPSGAAVEALTVRRMAYGTAAGRKP